MKIPPDRWDSVPLPPPKKQRVIVESPTKLPKVEARNTLIMQPSLTKGKGGTHYNRVTPASAIPQISSEKLKETLFGKYHLHQFKNSFNTSRDTTLPQRQPSHVWSSTQKDTIMKGKNREYRLNGGNRQRKLIDTTSQQGEIAIALPPFPTGIPKKRPKEIIKLDLIHEIKTLLAQKEPLHPPKFRFDITPEAASHNLHMLKDHKFNLDKLLNDKDRPSITNYGSEFKNVKQLEALLQFHPRWKAMKTLLTHGSEWKLMPVDDGLLAEDSIAAAQRGNHKSAKRNKEFLANALSKEIEKGWELLLPASAVEEIPNLVLSPMGVAEHLGVQEDGSFAPKLRLTHDLSFPGARSEQSINSRVVEDALEPCMFGHALLRLIHRIVHLRSIHPNMKIWIRKDDAKSAYRRIHLNAATSFQTAVQIEIEGVNYILLALRLPFGGSPCPSEFCLVSDVITDIINDLLACEHWDPYWMYSSYVKHIPGPKSLPPHIPFAPALETSVPNRENDRCTADVFIDDVITVGVDTGNNVEKLMAAPCTVMHALAHASEKDTFLPRHNFIAADKNEAEGAPEEVKIVLGWEINTRELMIKLPQHKHKAWSDQLMGYATRQRAGGKDLQSLLGRMEQVATIIPMFGHFLNNIRSTEIRATATGKPQFINKRTREDLLLAQMFLAKAAEGVNLNLMSFRSPTHIYINDASEHGIGGFATHGRAWSWVIPPKLRGRAHINLLEFIAQLVSIWTDILEKKVKPLDCLLGMGDNTASMGWMRRANFRAKDENDQDWYAKQVVARQLATLVLQSNTVLYRQWFRGVDNVVADSLSRDAYFLPPNNHQHFLSQTTSHQVPSNFKILPVHNRISSFISSTLLQLPVQRQRLCQPKPSELALGHPGILSSYKLESLPCSLKTSQGSNKTSSYQRLPKPQERPPSLAEIEESWWKAQSMPPSHMWHRPSGQTTGLTPDWTWTVRHASSSKNSSGGTGTKMVREINKKHYP